MCRVSRKNVPTMVILRGALINRAQTIEKIPFL